MEYLTPSVIGALIGSAIGLSLIVTFHLVQFYRLKRKYDREDVEEILRKLKAD